MNKILFFILFAPFCIFGQTSQGPNSGGTFTSVSYTGPSALNINFVNPDNAATDNNVFSTVNISEEGATGYPNYLRASNFGFSIPSGSTINGIEVVSEQKYNTFGDLLEGLVYIVKADGTIGTINKANTSTFIGLSDEPGITYGSSSDLWGESWTYSDINDPDFGIVITPYCDGCAFTIFYIDHIRITVYYTESGGSGEIKKS